MKISLIMCPLWNVDQPPLSIAYIAGQLESVGYDVFCHDFSIDLIHTLPSDERETITQKYLVEGWYTNFDFWRKKLSIDTLVDGWADEVLRNSPKLVGFSIYDATLSVSILLAEAIKKKAPETSIVFGGPSCDKKEIILRGPIDFLVYGEGEETITDLAERIENQRAFHDCPGIVFREDGNIVQTTPRPPIGDINTIPFPDFNDFNLFSYPSKALPMFTSRGCPNRCSFCSESPRWGRYRFRTAENIVMEMVRDVETYGIKHFSMEDSTINGKMDQFEKMCDLVILKKLEVTWGGKARIDLRMSPDLLRKACRAGCRGFIFGIESASQRVLDHMKKNVHISDVETVILNSYQAGIQVGCFFIIGYVNETETDFQETLEFIRKNHKYIHTIYQGNGLYILSGSRLHDRAEEYGIILPEFSPDGEWCTKDGMNTKHIRTDRLKLFNNLVNELYHQ
jgi:radical SAM superfamily enzyme YgiQ (UPF0313 family)